MGRLWGSPLGEERVYAEDEKEDPSGAEEENVEVVGPRREDHVKPLIGVPAWVDVCEELEAEADETCAKAERDGTHKEASTIHVATAS